MTRKCTPETRSIDLSSGHIWQMLIALQVPPAPPLLFSSPWQRWRLPQPPTLIDSILLMISDLRGCFYLRFVRHAMRASASGPQMVMIDDPLLPSLWIHPLDQLCSHNILSSVLSVAWWVPCVLSDPSCSSIVALDYGSFTSWGDFCCISFFCCVGGLVYLCCRSEATFFNVPTERLLR